MNNKKKIVILGAGFGGLYAYLELAKLFRKDQVEIALINETGYFLFVPLIHEVATGALPPRGVIQDIRDLPKCNNCRFIEATIESVDLDNRELIVKSDKLGVDKIKYDFLVSALGAETNFFAVPGAQENSLVLKNLNNAKRVKNAVIERFEEANKLIKEEAQPSLKLRRATITNPLRFVIVGGGPTGVELAGELADLINHDLYRVYPQLKGLAEIVLIHAGDRLVPQMGKWFDRKARRILVKKDVKILYNTQVTKVGTDKVILGNKVISAKTIIWCAGVKARELKIKTARAIERDSLSERLKVNNYLQLPNYKNIFVVGDQAWICDREKGQPYPMRAQFAVREGQITARNIYNLANNKALQEFFWKDQGFILSLGKGGALVQAFGLKFSGPLAWWLYRTVYLFKLVGWRARVSTAWRWTLGLLRSRDINKL